MKLNIEKLGKMIQEKRGDKGLRAAAEEIGGVSASTLSRIEQGNLPDIDTFLRLCTWLGVSTEFFTDEIEGNRHPQQKDIIAHLRAERTLPKETTEALIKLISLAYESRRGPKTSHKRK